MWSYDTKWAPVFFVLFLRNNQLQIQIHYIQTNLIPNLLRNNLDADRNVCQNLRSVISQNKPSSDAMVYISLINIHIVSRKAEAN